MPYKNIEDRKAYDKKYRLNNKDKINAYHREWSRGEEAQKKIKKYRIDNRECQLAYWVEYRKQPKNKKKFNEYFNKWATNRRKTDPHFKLKQNLSHRVYKALNGITKSKRTMELVGCTIEKLWKHLEKKFTKGMTRENHGKWHIDHIKPCALFDLTDTEQQTVCFHYTNLQPLWAIDNIKKGKKYE